MQTEFMPFLACLSHSEQAVSPTVGNAEGVAYFFFYSMTCKKIQMNGIANISNYQWYSCHIGAYIKKPTNGGPKKEKTTTTLRVHNHFHPRILSVLPFTIPPSLYICRRSVETN